MAQPKVKKTPTQRLEARILYWAMAFCEADNRFREGWAHWKNLCEYHFPEAPCFQVQGALGDDEDDGYAVNARDALSRSQWCKACVEFINGGTDYKKALYDRKIAKSYMKRAFKELSKAKL